MYERLARRWLPAAGVAIGVMLLAAPLLAILIESLLVPAPGGHYLSVNNYWWLISDARFGEAMLNTFFASSCTTVLSLILGGSLAIVVARTDLPGRRLLALLNLTPLFLSPYAGALAWTWLLAPHGGLLTTWSRDGHGINIDWLSPYNLHGIILVMTLFYTPYVYLYLVPSLRAIDSGFEDIARVFGATFWYAQRHIVFPMLAPALSAAALIVFVTSAGLFDVAAALGVSRGIDFVPTRIQEMAIDPAQIGRAAAFAVLFVVLTGALALWQRANFPPWPRVGDVRRATRRLMHLTPLAAIAVWLFELSYVAIAAVIPMATLVMVSLSKQWIGHYIRPVFLLAQFTRLLTEDDQGWDAIRNSLILAALGATICVAVAVSQGYYLTRGPGRSRKSTAAVLTIAFGIPGVVVGLGFLTLTLGTPVRGALAIMIVAFVARFLPFAIENATTMFHDIDPDLELAARKSGARWRQSVRLILLPLMRPAVFASWLMLFVIFLRELGTAVLIESPVSRPISVAMLRLSDNEPGQAAALAVLQMLILLLAFIVFGLSRASLFPRAA